jgi:protoporphyrinogen oxidase
VVDLWKEIFPDDFIERPRLSRIYYGGKYYSYPLNAFKSEGSILLDHDHPKWYRPALTRPGMSDQKST